MNGREGTTATLDRGVDLGAAELDHAADLGVTEPDPEAAELDRGADRGATDRQDRGADRETADTGREAQTGHGYGQIGTSTKQSITKPTHNSRMRRVTALAI